MRDYVALTKPKILWLLLLVALASAVIAARTLPPIVTLVGLFLAGTLSSMGSLALNSYLEMDVDAKMKRTRNRPLPAERIVQPRRALAFGLSLVALGLVDLLVHAHPPRDPVHRPGRPGLRPGLHRLAEAQDQLEHRPRRVRRELLRPRRLVRGHDRRPADSLGPRRPRLRLDPEPLLEPGRDHRGGLLRRRHPDAAFGGRREEGRQVHRREHPAPDTDQPALLPLPGGDRRRSSTLWGRSSSTSSFSPPTSSFSSRPTRATPSSRSRPPARSSP